MKGPMRMARLDILTMKPQYAAYLSLVFMVLLFGFMGSSLVLLCITGAWFAALMIATVFVIQEKNGLERLYGSVSLRLRDMVRGRYLFVLLNYAVSIAAVMLMACAFSLFRGEKIMLTDAALGLGLSFLVFAAITGIQLPLYFRLGYAKAKLWSMVPFVAVLGLLIIPQIAVALVDVPQTALMHPGAMTIICLLLGCAVMLVSCRISEAASRRRR